MLRALVAVSLVAGASAQSHAIVSYTWHTSDCSGDIVDSESYTTEGECATHRPVHSVQEGDKFWPTEDAKAVGVAAYKDTVVGDVVTSLAYSDTKCRNAMDGESVFWQQLAASADSTEAQLRNTCGEQPGGAHEVIASGAATAGVCYHIFSCNGVEMSLKVSIDGAGDPSSQSIHHLSTKADHLPDCDDLQGIGNTFSAACPSAPAGAYVPTVCTLECAASYNPWYKQCSAGDDIKALNRQSNGAFASFYETCDSGALPLLLFLPGKSQFPRAFWLKAKEGGLMGARQARP